MFAKASDYAGSSFFKPAEHMTDLALLIEPKSIAKNVPSEYKGQVRQRDEVVADISVFANQQALNDAKPTAVHKSCKVVHGMLTSTIEKIIGGAMVVVVTKTATRNGEGYVFRDVEPAVSERVGVYFTAREAEVEANLADAPSFD